MIAPIQRQCEAASWCVAIVRQRVMLGRGLAKGSQIATFREDVDPVHLDFEQDGSHRVRAGWWQGLEIRTRSTLRI